MGTRGEKVRLLIVRHGETDCNVQGIIQGQLDTDLNDVGRRQADFVGAALRRERIDEVYASPLRRAKDTADAIVACHPSHSHGRLPYWLDDRLKERGFGALEGKTFDRSKPKRDSMDGIEQMSNFIARLSAFLTDVLTHPAPFAPVQERASEAEPEWVDEQTTRPATLGADANGVNGETNGAAALPRTGGSRTVLLVSHGAAISALVGTFLMDTGLATVAAGIQRTRIWNCSITEITVDTAQLPITDGKVDLTKVDHNRSPKAFIVERWADVRHLPDEIDDAVTNQGNADEMVGKAAAP